MSEGKVGVRLNLTLSADGVTEGICQFCPLTLPEAGFGVPSKCFEETKETLAWHSATTGNGHRSDPLWRK